MARGHGLRVARRGRQPFGAILQQLWEGEPSPPTLWRAWVDRLAASVLRPWVLAGGFTVVLVAGVLVGGISAAAQSRDSARAAYVASVAPDALH